MAQIEAELHVNVYMYGGYVHSHHWTLHTYVVSTRLFMHKILWGRLHLNHMGLGYILSH